MALAPVMYPNIVKGKKSFNFILSVHLPINTLCNDPEISEYWEQIYIYKCFPGFDGVK